VGESGTEFVVSLPDLIEPEEYDRYPGGGLIRIRVIVTDAGVELIGDSLRPALLENLLAALGGGVIEQMLCG
jgi:hypothetical protein